MKQRGVGSIVALAGDGPPLGLLTDADLRSKVIAEVLNLDTPVERVMRTPVRTVDPDTDAFDRFHSLAA